MSNQVSALQGASNADGIATIREMGLRGMITLRGEIGTKPIAKAVKAATGTSVPEQGRIAINAERAAAWMSPDELLLMVDHADAAGAVRALETALSKVYALAINVSDARAVFEVEGPFAREVLAKLAPVDFSPAAFEVGQFRRTRLAQVPAAIWMTDPETFHLVCFRSVAGYVFDLLSVAAQPGSEVDVYPEPIG
jgi:sarcosine oxidase subunit gamma